MRKYIIVTVVVLIVAAGGLFWLGLQAEQGIPDEQDIRISIDNPFQ